MLAMQQRLLTHMSTTVYSQVGVFSFIQLSRLRRREENENAQTSKRWQWGWALNCESGILPLSYRAPQCSLIYIFVTLILQSYVNFTFMTMCINISRRLNRHINSPG